MTYAIVARDDKAGEMGGAVQTHFFNCGAVVLWPEAGTGVVATMAMAETAYGRLGLHSMRQGATAEAALAQLLSRDSMAAVRQVAMLRPRGAPAAHTGSGCIPAAGHQLRPNVVALGNMLTHEGTWDRMVEAFEAASGSLAERLLGALEAAEETGGDVRGSQSAAIVVVKTEDDPAAGEIGTPGVVPQVDLRVDDSREPLAELRRLLIFDAFYKKLLVLLTTVGLFAGPFNCAQSNWSDAVDFLRWGQQLLGEENQEATFWLAVLLARAGKLEAARQQMTVAVAAQPSLRQLVMRLVGQNMLTESQAAALCG